MRFRTLIPMLFFMLPFWVCAQSFPDLKLFPAYSNSPWPTNNINGLLTDSNRLMWLSTETGSLLRYDGSFIKEVITPDKTTASLYGLSIDKTNRLYISSSDGLIEYDPLTHNLKRFRHIDNVNTSIADDDKPNPFVDSKNRVWVCTTKGLQQLDNSSGNFIAYHTPELPSTISKSEYNHLGKMAEDRHGDLWIASAYGLYKIDTTEKKLIPFYYPHFAWITGIFIDAQQQFWLTTWGIGLIKFDPVSGMFSDVHFPNIQTNIFHSPCEYIDINQKRWLCFSDYESLLLLDPVTEKLNRYFVGTRINSVYNDKNNRIWLSTSDGLQLVDNVQQQITTIPLHQQANLSPGEFGLAQYWLDAGNEIWLSGYFAKGLYKFTKDFKFIAHTKTIPPTSKSYFSSIIYKIITDKNQNTWYSTDSGLVKQTGNTFRVILPAGEFNKEKGTTFRDVLQRSDGRWWIRSYRNGMYLFDPVKESFEKYIPPKDATVVSASVLDKQGKLWIGTDKGLFQFDEEGKKFLSYPMQHTGENGNLLWNKIIDLLCDNQNRIWLATHAGITFFDEEKKQFSFPDKNNRIGFSPSFRLLQDDDNNIWAIAKEKLITINPENWKVQTFGSETGLPVGFDDYAFFHKTMDGNIWLAYTGGLIRFNPKKLLDNNNDNGKIIITDVYEDGESIAYKNNPVITVNKNTSQVRIRFAYTNYSLSEKNILYYKVSQKNVNIPWQKSNGEISLVNLAPGTYTLELKGENLSLNKSPVIASFTVIIPPRWYQTLFFKALLLLIALSIFYFLMKWRIRNIKFKADIKQKMAESEMAALKAQMNPHFMFNCINSIDSFIYSNDKYNATLYLNKFAKLLRNILDNSKENTVLLSKDIDTLKLYVELEELRHEGKFAARFNIDEDIVNSPVMVPPLIIQPFVENAILHGLRNKNSNDGILDISIQKSGGSIEYIITDNGIGRTASALLNKNKPSSHGMNISFDRIRLFNQEENPSVIIKDRIEGDSQSGTTVIVSLKTKYRYD